MRNSQRSHTFSFSIRATFYSDKMLKQGASYETRIEATYRNSLDLDCYSPTDIENNFCYWNSIDKSIYFLTY